MAKTRTTKASTKSTVATSTSSTTLTEKRYPPLIPSAHPPKLYSLPLNRSKDATFIPLLNPATSTPCHFYHCPRLGLHEVKEVTYPASQPRSWLIEPPSDPSPDAEPEAASEIPTEKERQGYILETPSLYQVTPIDPLFVLLPVLHPASSASRGPSNAFQTLDDHLDSLIPSYPHYALLLRTPQTRAALETRAAAICDMVEIDDEPTMYRLSIPKLAREVLWKARRMVYGGGGRLPASMEGRFVSGKLEMPETESVVEEGGLGSDKENEDPKVVPALKAGELGLSVGSAEFSAQVSQATASSVEDASASTAAGSPDLPQLYSLLRLRTALTFILYSYVPPTLHTPILDALTSSSPISPSSALDFKPLDQHLARILELKKEAAVSAALNSESMYTSKRSREEYEDGDSFASRAEKKARLEKEEREKERKRGSQGLRNLKKVDTSGMRKMSSFFTKPAVKK